MRLTAVQVPWLGGGDLRSGMEGAKCLGCQTGLSAHTLASEMQAPAMSQRQGVA